MYIKRISFVLIILSFIGGAVFSYFIYARIFCDNTEIETDTQEVFIPTGASFSEVLKIVSPYIKDKESFRWLAEKKGYINNVKPGRYLIDKGSNNNDIIRTLRRGNTPIKVRFNNQERLENLAGRVSSIIEADSISLLEAFKDPEFLKQNEFTSDNALAMYIPNSYEFYWNTDAKGFRDRMLREYQIFWNKKRKAKAKSIDLTPAEVVTLASIVHKESVKVKERPRIAGVYMNRLENNWKLDADPTVIYTIKKVANDWDLKIRRVLHKDLKIEHPYNTYRNKGLPPGPIVTPDVSAINAVLNHENHDYFYFVADVENYGFHKFAKSLRQHNNLSRSYHKWANKKRIKR